jgi:RNA polymerase sigma-70 factor (ECF subfamily)
MTMPAMTVAESPATHPAKKPPVVAHDAKELKKGLVALIPELRGRAARLCGDRTLAEDLVQDTIERALRFEEQYERGTNLRAWAYQILFSVFVTRYRRTRRERNALKHLATDPCAWTSPTAFRAPDADAPLLASTQAKLDQLPEGFRAVLVLVDLQERSYREAATTLGVPVGTVMSRLFRGRRLLAEKMTDEMDRLEAA